MTQREIVKLPCQVNSQIKKCIKIIVSVYDVANIILNRSCIFVILLTPNKSYSE